MCVCLKDGMMRGKMASFWSQSRSSHLNTMYQMFRMFHCNDDFCFASNFLLLLLSFRYTNGQNVHGICSKLLMSAQSCLFMTGRQSTQNASEKTQIHNLCSSLFQTKLNNIGNFGCSVQLTTTITTPPITHSVVRNVTI